jgi:hypothetical protein
MKTRLTKILVASLLSGTALANQPMPAELAATPTCRR